MKHWLLAASIGMLASPLAAVECRDVEINENSFSVCEVDMTAEDLRLFLYDGDGQVLGQFAMIASALNEDDQDLAFAMNAGMYHSDRSPVGHYIEDGHELMRVVPNAGPGNFGLLPNGVFCIGQGRADVIETLAYIENPPDCHYATQSGPMLVIDGELHPRFLVDSTSRYIRNGVGTSADGTRVVFAISNHSVTFHEFGRLYRDVLKLPNALYFDGNISRLYAPQLNRNDAGFALGPVVGVVEDLE